MKAKIHHGKVYLDNVVVGYVSFMRGFHKLGIDINGEFIFITEGKVYKFDTSCFSYSKDANDYIRFNLKERGHDFLKDLVKDSRELTKLTKLTH